MAITKIFTQEHISNDCEARKWDWEDTEETYESLKEELKKWNGWFDGVRVVEKIFNEETFTIETKVIKKATRAYDGWNWKKGEIIEEFY